MTVKELLGYLSAYDEDLEVKIYDDWGSGYVLREVTNVLDTTEFEENESVVVVLCFEVGAKE